MKYPIVYEQSEEGFAVSVPALPGCHSQGLSEREATENIEDAIRDYLHVFIELNHGKNYLDLVRTLENIGFKIMRKSKHIVMSNGMHIVTIPRHNPINAITMGNIVRDIQDWS
ncbi:MAG: hypothetical protein DM484_10120 [Candidatus Methylumidiphilus alinenensis]|uniref:HicB-like antitoxin of toxin-antitoxin system domain-containing protein n=1 Tax=Candidatus Methylumidiphilus alinenensis TaxID=2202197 RepID=A0A2W4R7Z7_9GAMM|nr:MAG: hypothetical protein DM484_10120 [Candidatus Methylumidiphilus alinenensis]